MKNILNFQTLPKREQVRKCAEIFGIEAKYALDYVEKLPNFSTFIPEDIRPFVKWCAVPNTSANLNAYEKSITCLVKKRCDSEYGYRIEAIKQNQAYVDMLDKISSHQAGDILLLPVIIIKHDNVFPEQIQNNLLVNEFPLGLQSVITICAINDLKDFNFACLGDNCMHNGQRLIDNYFDLCDGFIDDIDTTAFVYQNRYDDVPIYSLNTKEKTFDHYIRKDLLKNIYSIHVFCPYENWGSVNSCEILNRPTNYFELLELYIQKFPLSSDKVWFHHFSDLAECVFGKNLRYQMDFDDFENWFEKNVNSSEVQAVFLKHQKIMKKLSKEDNERRKARKWTIEKEIAFQMTAINHPERLVFGTPQGLFDND